jgi:anaerobic selenocysteine-containing dehydrogenase
MRIGEKGEGKFKRITWDQALAIIKERLSEIINQSGPESIIGYFGMPSTLEMYWLFPRLFYSFGSPNVFSPYPTGISAWSYAASYMMGATPCRDIIDFEYTKCFILWGSNQRATEFPFSPQYIKNNKLIVIDPRAIPLSKRADEYIQIRPGTDGILALSIAQVIIKDNLYDKGFIDKWISGFEGYRYEVLKNEYSPENASKICGISPDQIIKVAKIYANNKPSVIIGGSGLSKHSNGFETCRAVHALAALTGNINIPGGNVYLSFPIDPLKGPGSLYYRIYDSSRWDKRVAELPSGYLDPLRMWDIIVAKGDNAYWKDYIFKRLPYGKNLTFKGNVYRGYDGRAYKIRGMIILASNPLISLPNEYKGRVALKNLEFLIVIDRYITNTGLYADIILPSAPPPESIGLVPSNFPVTSQYISLMEKIIEPRGESRSDKEIISLIGKSIGMGKDFMFNDREYIDYLLSSSPYTSKITLDKLRKSPIKKIPLFNIEDLKNKFNTSSGKIELSPPPTWFPPVESLENTPDFARKYPLILINGRSRYMSGSWTRNVKSLNKHLSRSFIEINPIDAKRLNLKDGEEVYVESKAGREKFRVLITDNIKAGVVWAMSNGANTKGTSWNIANDLSNINRVIDDMYNDPVSGSPRYNEMLVKIYK